MLITHNFLVQFPGSDADALLYDFYGKEISDFLKGNSEGIPEISSSYYYSYFVGVLYVLFGSLKILPEVINSLLSLILIIVVYNLTFIITNNYKMARLSAFIIFIFPTINLYSVFVMRETTILFFFLLSFYYLVKWNNIPNIKYIIFSITSMLICIFFHDAFVFIGIIYVLFFFMYSPTKQKIDILAKKNFILIPIIGMASIVFFSFLINKLPGLTTIFSTDFLSEHVIRRSRDRASYLQGINPSNPFDLIYQTPIRAVFFLFTPFIWMLSNVVDLLGFLDKFIYLILAFYSFNGLKYLKEKNRFLYYLIIIIIIIFLIIFGWGTSNYGAAMRHRAKISWLFVILGSIGFISVKKKKVQ